MLSNCTFLLFAHVQSADGEDAELQSNVLQTMHKRGSPLAIWTLLAVI